MRCCPRPGALLLAAVLVVGATSRCAEVTIEDGPTYDANGQPDEAVPETHRGDLRSDNSAHDAANTPDETAHDTADTMPDITVFQPSYVPSDFDRDGLSDLATYRADGGFWNIMELGGTVLATEDQWGYEAAVNVAGDYDGDGYWELAVFSPADAKWYIRTLAPPETLLWDEVWGPAMSVPVPGDYNGDFATDMALYTPATNTWYVRTLAGQPLVHEVVFGGPNAIPVPGDYDGDGVYDLAWFDALGGFWHAQSIAGEVILDGQLQWGYPGTIPFSGDFDGDGIDDLGIFDPAIATWYILSVPDGQQIMMEEVWGPAGSVVVVGEFDHDGIDDLAVYDCQTGDWHARSVTWGMLEWHGKLGGTQAVPVEARFVPECSNGICRPGTCRPPVVNNVVDIGPEESAGPGGLMKPDIAVDSQNQPHIVTIKGGTELHLFHRLAGLWQGGFFAGLAEYHPTSSDFNRPIIEVDAKDRAWVMSGLWGDPVVAHQNCPVGSGPAVWLVNSVATGPAKQPCFGPHDFPGNWFHGGHGMDLALDPHFPDQAVVGDGRYSIYLTADGVVPGTIGLECGHGGEKTEIAVGPVDGGPGVFHALAGRGNDGTGFPYDGTYVNSAMPKQEAWVLAEVYPHMLEQEGGWWSLGIDWENPQAAYIYAPLVGTTINIWDGTKMLYPPDNLYVVDASAADCGNGMYRYTANWAPALGGGAFLCWTGPVNGVNHVRLKYLTHTSESAYGPIVDIAPGNQCSIATDTNGNVHVVYMNGDVKYRKLTMGQ